MSTLEGPRWDSFKKKSEEITAAMADSTPDRHWSLIVSGLFQEIAGSLACIADVLQGMALDTMDQRTKQIEISERFISLMEKSAGEDEPWRPPDE